MMTMSKKGTGKFIFGAALGAGLGLLFAPNKGDKTRKELKEKLSKLYADAKKQIKEIDKDEVKADFDKKVDDIKSLLDDMDKEKALEIAKEKSKELAKKTEELVSYAVEKGTPVVQDTAKKIKKETIKAAKSIIKKLEEN